jgi:hypothetical protein
MPTLADVLRQTGYAQDGTLATPTPTESPMTNALADHIKSIPQKFNENQAYQMELLGKAFPGNTYESMMTQGDPKAMAELAMQTPFNAMVAYHGTPHNILGKFDISKVGTGEGAQAYGHGMYFAEHPTTAEWYSVKGANQGKMPTPPRPSDFLLDNSRFYKQDNQLFKQVGDKLDEIPVSKEEYGQALRTAQADFQKRNQAGNLYKVDIPDEYIPNMLDWDKPVAEDMRKRISKATMEAFGNGATGTSGEKLYKEIVFEMRRNGSKAPEADAAKWLNEQGIKGIRYEDAGSRGKGGNTTSNFVVFDPSEVKILEKNSKPVSRKELLQQEFNKIEGGEKPIRSAVVMIGDKIFTGNTHTQAFEKAIQEGVVRKEGSKFIYPKGAEIDSDLFMLRDGRIVDRLTASRLHDVGASEGALRDNKMQIRPANSMDVDEYMRQAKELKKARGNIE